MEAFEITVEHNGTAHLLHIKPHAEEPEFRVYMGDDFLGTVRNEMGENEDLWTTTDLMDAEFVEKIGERIEKYER